MARDVVPFDFGWKHRTGLTEWALPDDLPPNQTDPGIHPPEAAKEYDVSSWKDIQLPHDGLIATSPSMKACPGGCSGRSYIPRHLLWYRKNFSLPEDWKNSAIWLEFDGSFRNTTVWINGEWIMNHVCGYTPFRIRLDNLTTASFGSMNTIAVFVDPDNGDEGSPSSGSGWWYEGGGLYRHARLLRTGRVHVDHDSLYAYSNISYTSDAMARDATLHIEITAVNEDSKIGNVCGAFLVLDADGLEIAASEISPLDLEMVGDGITIAADIKVLYPHLWTSSSPYLYEIIAVLEDCNTGERLDKVSTYHGFRSLRFDANQGFSMNQEHFKVRGFCDHDTFGVVGMAVPDRINLFRVSSYTHSIFSTAD